MQTPCACTEKPHEAVPKSAGRLADGGSRTAEALEELDCIVYGPDVSNVDETPIGFERLAREWNELVRSSRSNTIFLTYEWQTTWWRHLGHGELWLVAFRRPQSGELIGIAPLYLFEDESGETAGKRRFSLVGCIEVSDYLDLIIASGWEAAVSSSLLKWLYSDAAPEWDFLDLCNLPEDSLTYREFAQQAERRATKIEVFREDVAPQFDLPAHYDTYLSEQVDKKQRHEIRRKQRRAEREADIGFYMVGPEHCLEAEVDDFIALQRASREDKSEFMTPEMHRFFMAAARTMFDAGYLRMWFLTINGEKAAALFGFEYEKRYLLYNSGYDPDAYSHLSPGWVLLAYCIQYTIATGGTRFDFMQGDEAYKYRFGSKDYQVMRVIVSH